MNDAVRMSERQGGGEVPQDAKCVTQRERAFPTQSSAQRLASNERHGVIERVSILRRRKHRNDQRVLELRGEVDLAPESLDAHLRGQLWREHLDDDLASETRLFRHEHARHTAHKLMLEGVRTAEATSGVGRGARRPRMVRVRVGRKLRQGGGVGQPTQGLPGLRARRVTRVQSLSRFGLTPIGWLISPHHRCDIHG